jgi:phosphoserine phosphatase
MWCNGCDKCNTGKLVFLVSGGLGHLIAPVAAALLVPSHRIFANEILFDENGEYLGSVSDR